MYRIKGHCLWNCLMTRSFGERQAKIIADNHEDYRKGPCLETDMDLHNNEEGREYGTETGLCQTLCETGTTNGELQIALGSGPCKSTGTGSASENYYSSSTYGGFTDFDDILIDKTTTYLLAVLAMIITMAICCSCACISGGYFGYVMFKQYGNKYILSSNQSDGDMETFV